MIINFSNIGSAGGSGGTYTLPIATETRLGGVKVGSGLTIDHSTGVLSASGGTGSQVSVTQVVTAGTKIATVSVDGADTDLFAPEGAKTYVLNLMTQEERAALYTDLIQYSGSSSSVSSALPIEDYYFYVWDTGVTDFRSFIPVYIAFCSTDFGGSIFFTSVTTGRNNDGVIHKTRFILKYDGTFEKTDKKMSVEVEIVGLSYSWTGQLKYDADNSQFMRGSTVLDPALSHSNFESSTRMDELINKFIALDSGASNRLLTPDLPFVLVSGGTEHKYTEPTIDGEDISAVTIDGQTYSRKYSFIYTEEDGSRFIIRMKLNSSQKATGFEYEYVPNGGGSSVSVQQTLTAGTKIGTITVNGTGTDLFAPEVGSGSPSNTRVVMLNKLTQQERLALYNELSSLYDYNAEGFTSAYTEDMFAFYIDLRDSSDQQAFGLNDKYEGFFPMQLERMHPSDYGAGAAFFVGLEGTREGNLWVANVRYVITYDGNEDKACWQRAIPEEASYNRSFLITSAGTIAQDQYWEGLNDGNKISISNMEYDFSSDSENVPCKGNIKWWNYYKIDFSGETKNYYVWSADVLIGNTIYTGVWGMIQDHWSANDANPPQCLSWTSGATITLPYQPLP